MINVTLSPSNIYIERIHYKKNIDLRTGNLLVVDFFFQREMPTHSITYGYVFFCSFFYDVLICCIIKAEWNILNTFVKKKKILKLNFCCLPRAILKWSH